MQIGLVAAVIPKLEAMSWSGQSDVTLAAQSRKQKARKMPEKAAVAKVVCFFPTRGVGTLRRTALGVGGDSDLSTLFLTPYPFTQNENPVEELSFIYSRASGGTAQTSGRLRGGGGRGGGC